MKKVLMKCGHIGYATDKNNKPYCLICNCDKIAEDEKIDLKDRTASCYLCGKIAKSSYDLPFFEPKELFNPKSKHDSYYCGCGGWE